MSELVNVSTTSEIPVGKMKSVNVKGKEILLVNYGGKYYAIGNRCTHMGGDLSKGSLDGKIVTCPRHGSQFDVTSGHSLRGPKIAFLRLKTKDEPAYEVKVEGQNIQVNI